MTQRHSLAAIVILAGFALFTAACSTRASQPPTATTEAVSVPSATATTRPAATHTATHRPTRTLAVTATPTETATPTPLPVEWLVDARELPGLPPEGGQAAWADPHTLEVQPYGEEMEGMQILYDLSRLPFARAIATVPPLFHHIEDGGILYSPEETYAVVCTEKTQDEQGRVSYGGLQLYQVAEDRLISQVSGVITSCPYSLRWSEDETLLSFASDRPDEERDTTDIYAWKMDGSPPYVIGQGTYMGEPGNWSPDGTRLVVEVFNWDAQVPEDENTYRILYPDGRPARQTRAQLGSRAPSGPSWLTEEIVYEVNIYTSFCEFYDYYLADTGEHLEDLSWSDWGCGLSLWMNNQHPLISEDKHWFVLDQSKAQIGETSSTAAFNYTLYDLKARRRFPLSQSEEVFLDFAGWGDHRTFYLIRRPANDQVTAQPDAPFGLLALDPTRARCA